MAAPVKLATTKFYPVDNYGSAMAPFYSVLSIWVGGTILVAMLKVNLDRKRREKLRNLKNYQLYLGRYLLFLIIGLLQSGLICLGDLYFLEIQCLHPWHFLMAGWFTSIVFVNILYTLTVSFGDVGKAICVVLMVIQVAGSGGTFPIEMTPAFFQRVYHLLPFTHAMGGHARSHRRFLRQYLLGGAGLSEPVPGGIPFAGAGAAQADHPPQRGVQ